MYLRVLRDIRAGGEHTVSSERLAELGGLTSAQVRKDLSFFGNFGVRGRGYDVGDLQKALTRILGLDHPWKTVVVGAGRLGSALTSYPEFTNQGFHIVAVFDVDESKLGTYVGNREIRPVKELRAYAEEESISVGIIATPQAAAQDAADHLVAGGVRGILNFAPAALDVPPGVTVRNVNLAIELEGLSFAITEANNLQAAIDPGDPD
jgi:redox-sensing transcriptional repressor